jgi:hypothetical protein
LVWERSQRRRATARTHESDTLSIPKEPLARSSSGTSSPRSSETGGPGGLDSFSSASFISARPHVQPLHARYSPQKYMKEGDGQVVLVSTGSASVKCEGCERKKRGRTNLSLLTLVTRWKDTRRGLEVLWREEGRDRDGAGGVCRRGGGERPNCGFLSA